jgi:hypothetical protein
VTLDLSVFGFTDMCRTSIDLAQSMKLINRC